MEYQSEIQVIRYNIDELVDMKDELVILSVSLRAK